LARLLQYKMLCWMVYPRNILKVVVVVAVVVVVVAVVVVVGLL
jgi:hypothetical protein